MPAIAIAPGRAVHAPALVLGLIGAGLTLASL